MDRLFSVKEAAARLACSEAMPRKWMYEMKLPYVKVGRAELVQGADLQRISLQQRFVPSWYGAGPLPIGRQSTHDLRKNSRHIISSTGIGGTDMKQQLDKWEQWLEVVYKDMVHQAGSRTVFKKTEKIIEANPDIPKDSDFLDYLRQWYVDSAVMGFRRQLKVNQNSVSLVGLLEDIERNTSLLSRERFVGRYPKALRHQANKTFDELAGVGATHMDTKLVHGHIKEFKSRAERCEKYADRFVAHRDKRDEPDFPSWKELDEAIDLMESLFKKYYLLLRGDSLVSVSPRFITPWEEIFETAWLPERKTGGVA